ncbi:MAG: hypothetical protein DWQ07_13865 [Chloroflexi bacterium]|nr:MAG: hypothetical protein DWQ07_13865 [Chloroflexota bacterium]MBL1197422.1 hypothetical protein [Chloroflexota bacterium]NOH14717.1 hypothetical protein [Chloroflexota bacterium]
MDGEVLTIHTFFDNTLFRSIGIPTILTLIAAMLEYQLKIINGRGRGDRKYIAWIRTMEITGEVRTESRSHKRLDDIFIEYAHRLVDIEPMFVLRFSEFGSLGTNLAIGAIAVDISSIALRTNINTGIGLIVAHLGMLISIQILLTQIKKASPENMVSKEFQALFAIIFGFLSMFFAFLAI